MIEVVSRPAGSKGFEVIEWRWVVDDLRWRQGLARAREALARLEFGRGRRPEARDAVAKAATALEGLARLDPAYEYDLACVLALRGAINGYPGEAGSAIAALRRSIASGFDNAGLLRTDPRLEILRSRNEFPAAAAILPAR